MNGNDKSLFQYEIPGEAVFIIGAGHFGTRAARIICQRPESIVYIFDVDNKQLSHLKGLSAEKVKGDGIQFLVKNFDLLDPGHTIIPAIPMHLAFELIRGYLCIHRRTVKRISIPKGIQSRLPNTWLSGNGSLLTSYANFVCPDDCPEPDICTISGERRSQPLYERLKNIRLSGFNVHIIRSRQIAPGLGGVSVAELKKTIEKLRKRENEKWILGTACKCHGIATAFQITEVH